MKNNEIVHRRGQWGQQRRLEFIDARLAWEGRLNRAALTEFFGISVPQASIDFAKYMELAPGKMMYDVSEKAYIAAPGFTPTFTDDNSNRYLAELYALSAGMLAPDVSFVGAVPMTDIVRFPTRLVPLDQLRQVLNAIRESRGLTILYQSMTDPEPIKRMITPHALGYDGFRWHVRSFCHLRGGYRDFVFARILEMSATHLSGMKLPPDEDWNTMLDIVIVPHPALGRGARMTTIRDYGMIDGRLTIRARRAMAFYLLKRMGLVDPLQRPNHQYISLANRTQLSEAIPQLRQDMDAWSKCEQ